MNTRLRRWAGTSARVALGTGIAVAAVIAVTAAVAAPWPTYTAEPVRVEATAAPADTVLACDGALLSLGRTVEQAGEFGIAAEQSVVSGPAGTDAAVEALPAPAGSVFTAVTAAPVAGARPPLAAAGSSSVESADLRGFAASACRPPLMESWLVGGATTTGSSGIVLLTNPGPVPATVQLTVYGAAGAQSAPGGNDRVVAPRSQLAVPLAGLVANEASPVIRVTATGAPVAASLQTSLIRTLDPGGVDQVGPVPAASNRQVVPGVAVVAGDDDQAAPTAIVRLLAPASAAEARVTVVDEDGAVQGSPASVPLAADVPSELDLSALDPGRYTVVVDAEVPVVAAVWTATGTGAGSDFAWFAAAPEIETSTVVAVPNGSDPRLTVVAPGDTAVTVTLLSDDGATESIRIAPGEAATRELAAGALYTLEPDGPAVAGVSFSGDGAVAGFPVWGGDAAAPPITVFP